jgi:hypothetical protein
MFGALLHNPQGHLFTFFSHFSASLFDFHNVEKPPGHGIVAITHPQSVYRG